MRGVARAEARDRVASEIDTIVAAVAALIDTDAVQVFGGVGYDPRLFCGRAGSASHKPMAHHSRMSCPYSDSGRGPK